MAFVERVRNVILAPATEWPVIAGEPGAPAGLLTGYGLPLMAIQPAMMVLAGLLLGGLVGGFGGSPALGTAVGTGFGLVAAIGTFVVQLVVVIAIAYLVNALAPTFGAVADLTQAFKLVIYASTASWVSAVLLVVPGLGAIAMLLAAIYSMYTLYIGLPVLMKCPRERVVGYFASIVVAWLVIGLVLQRLALRMYW